MGRGDGWFTITLDWCPPESEPQQQRPRFEDEATFANQRLVEFLESGGAKCATRLPVEDKLVWRTAGLSRRMGGESSMKPLVCKTSLRNANFEQ
jgi:hypothetical protein